MQQVFTRPVGLKQVGCFVNTKRCPTILTGKRDCRVSAIAAKDATNQVSAAQLEKLKSWAGSKGVAVDKIAIASNIMDGSAMLVADKDISSGDTIFSVPDSIWISPDAVAKRSASGKAASGLEPWLQITLALMAEKAAGGKGGSEDWSAYLGSAPAVLDSPLFWTEEQLSMLQGTQLLQNLLGYKSFFAQTFSELQANLFSKDTSAFPPSAFNMESFMWAAATVRGRLHAPLDGNGPNQAMALVPLADSISHRRVGNVVLKPRSGGLFNRGQSLAVEATRPIRKGETLAMDYAQGKPDSAVLLDYGVLDPVVPQPGYQLPLALDMSERFVEDKVDILENAGLQTSMTFTLTPSADPTPEMMAFLRVMTLKGADGFLLEPLFRAEAWGFMLDPISKGNEEGLCALMAEGARSALAGYTTSISDDRAILASSKLAKGSREQTAVLIRMGEKEALDATLSFFEQRGSPEGLAALEYYQERRLKRLGLLDGKGKSTYDGFFDKGIA